MAVTVGLDVLSDVSVINAAELTSSKSRTHNYLRCFICFLSFLEFFEIAYIVVA